MPFHKLFLRDHIWWDQSLRLDWDQATDSESVRAKEENTDVFIIHTALDYNLISADSLACFKFVTALKNPKIYTVIS